MARAPPSKEGAPFLFQERNTDYEDSIYIIERRNHQPAFRPVSKFPDLGCRAERGRIPGNGGPAAAKLVAQKIHPMKTNCEVGLKETVEKLQEVLRSNPPPWIRKAMNKGQAPAFDED